MVITNELVRPYNADHATQDIDKRETETRTLQDQWSNKVTNELVRQYKTDYAIRDIDRREAETPGFPDQWALCMC